VPLSCALLGGFAIGARVSLLWQHSPNANVSECLYSIYTWFTISEDFRRFTNQSVGLYKIDLHHQRLLQNAGNFNYMTFCTRRSTIAKNVISRTVYALQPRLCIKLRFSYTHAQFKADDERVPSGHLFRSLHCSVWKHVSTLFCCNCDTHEPILVTFGKKSFEKVINQKIYYFPPHVACASALPGETENLEIATIHLNAACRFDNRITKHDKSWSLTAQPPFTVKNHWLCAPDMT